MSKKKTGTQFKIIKMYRKGENTFWKQIVSKLTGNLWYNQVNEVSKSGQGNLPNGMEKIRVVEFPPLIEFTNPVVYIVHFKYCQPVLTATMLHLRSGKVDK